MSKQGIEFMEQWLDENITPVVKLSINGDAASMSVELAAPDDDGNDNFIPLVPRSF
jgi:hypothetical protein